MVEKHLFKKHVFEPMKQISAEMDDCENDEMTD